MHNRFTDGVKPGSLLNLKLVDLYELTKLVFEVDMVKREAVQQHLHVHSSSCTRTGHVVHPKYCSRQYLQLPKP